MDERYIESARLFKALSDPTRLMIVDMLSCGELCACVILEKFNITQPTLSHHMKNLCDSGLIKWRKEGKWIHYSLNEKAVQEFKDYLSNITSFKKCCIFVEAQCCGGAVQ